MSSITSRRETLFSAEINTVNDNQGKQHNVIMVESKGDSVQVPHGSNIFIANTVAPDAGHQSSLLVKAGGQPAVLAIKDDTANDSKVAQMVTTATDLLQSKTDDLASPQSDMSMFSELAVSPPANESLHHQGILGDVIETAMTAAAPAVSKPDIIKKVNPLVDLGTSYDSPPNPDTPFHPLAPSSTKVGSPVPEDYELDDEAKQIELQAVSARLAPPGDIMVDNSVPPLHEPERAAVELGTINEVSEEVTENTTDTTTAEKPLAHVKRQGLKWLSTSVLLIGGAIAGVVVGILLVHFVDGTDLTPVEAS